MPEATIIYCPKFVRDPGLSDASLMAINAFNC